MSSPLTYLLDANICIYITKQKPPRVLARFEQLPVGTVAMSIITYGELLYGAEKSHFRAQVLTNLHELTQLIPVLSLPTSAAAQYATIRASLERQGQPIGNNDCWIAAHCRAAELILVTNNVQEFSKIVPLTLENWVTS